MSAVTRDELNRRLDLLEANRLTPARAAALAAQVKATPGEALTAGELFARLGLPGGARKAAPRLRVTLKPFGRNAGTVWMVWPDGSECSHRSVADARTCPRAVDVLSERRARPYGLWLRATALLERLTAWRAGSLR